MTKTAPTSAEVRQWARNKGMEVGERGRLSPDLLAAYSAAHGGPPVTKPAKKATKKAPTKKSAAKKAGAKRATSPTRKAPAKASSAPRVAAESPRFAAQPTAVRPSFRAAEPVAAPPAVTLDSARVAALEEQISKLASRLERLEAAKAAPKRGLFGRK
jgi:hypothetical protein